MEENIINLEKVEVVYTNNKLVSKKELEQNVKVSEENKQILLDHISNEKLCNHVYSYFEDEGELYLGIGNSLEEVEYIKVSAE